MIHSIQHIHTSERTKQTYAVLLSDGLLKESEFASKGGLSNPIFNKIITEIMQHTEKSCTKMSSRHLDDWSPELIAAYKKNDIGKQE